MNMFMLCVLFYVNLSGSDEKRRKNCCCCCWRNTEKRWLGGGPYCYIILGKCRVKDGDFDWEKTTTLLFWQWLVEKMEATINQTSNLKTGKHQKNLPCFTLFPTLNPSAGCFAVQQVSWQGETTHVLPPGDRLKEQWTTDTFANKTMNLFKTTSWKTNGVGGTTEFKLLPWKSLLF